MTAFAQDSSRSRTARSSGVRVAADLGCCALAIETVHTTRELRAIRQLGFIRDRPFRVEGPMTMQPPGSTVQIRESGIGQAGRPLGHPKQRESDATETRSFR